MWIEMKRFLFPYSLSSSVHGNKFNILIQIYIFLGRGKSTVHGEMTSVMNMVLERLNQKGMNSKRPGKDVYLEGSCTWVGLFLGDWVLYMFFWPFATQLFTLD